MTAKSANNNLIIKNTLLLYVRMFIMLFVNLYTSRVVLNYLGIDDFGIYNVVGGVVYVFSVISGALSAAISRFITFELGKGNVERLKRIFSSAVTIQFIIGVLIILLAEIFGVWFLNHKMNIPAERLEAANWVLQFSLLTFVVNLVSIPYNAAIIAHERMSAFAYIGILEAVGRLFIAYCIIISPFDKLVFYAVLMFIVALIVRFAYSCYCRRHFEECTYRFVYDKGIMKEMFSFAGWNFIGASSAVLRDQGGNIVLNLFGGPVINAARSIALQVNNAIYGFIVNFMTALNPQITKSYASADYKYMMLLLFQGARFSFYLLFMLSLPVLMCTHYLLALWLKIVPDYTVIFVQLGLIQAMCESISQPLIFAMLATGKIRNYQLVVGGLQMLNLPLAYLFLRWGYPPQTLFVIAIILSLCCFSARLMMLRKMIHLPVMEFIRKVFVNILAVSAVSVLIPLVLVYYMEDSFIGFIAITIVCLLCTSVSIYYVGCDYAERRYVHDKLGAVVMRFKG